MNPLNETEAVLEATEAQLREIVKDSLSRGEYADVSTVVALAQSIAELRRTLPGKSGGDAVLASSHSGRGTQVNQDIYHPDKGATPSAALRVKHQEKLEFPRFERHAKRLVKLGWSSKDKRVYEHRASYDAVEEICQRFAENAGSKKLLKMEKLLPMKTDSGDEIPSYQVYLVLKWLQQHGVIERQGKDGYVIVDGDFDLKMLWNRTLVR